MHVKCIHELCSLFCYKAYYLNFIIFIGTNLLIVTKVHKFLFYTLLCRKNMNMEENPSLWYFESKIVQNRLQMYHIDPNF
jgi:hypothetical protein